MMVLVCGVVNNYKTLIRGLVFSFILSLFVLSGTGVYAESTAPAIDAGKIFKASCASCHTIGKGVVVGPDLAGFHERRNLDWTLKWVKSSQTIIRSGDQYATDLYKKFNNVEMPDQNLTNEEITAVYEYIKTKSAEAAAMAPLVAATDQSAEGDEDSMFMIFIVMVVVLFILALVLSNIVSSLNALVREKQGLPHDERTSTQKYLDLLVKNKPMVAIALIVVLIIGMQNGIKALSNLGIQQGYAPEQPINFPHDKHAGDLKIDCKYCHSGAEKGKTAGIPSVNVCMNCHSVVKKDSPEIKKLYDAVQKNEPIKWIKVYNLPDHVYFNHAQHVKVGGVECQKCHGPVETMKVVRKEYAINMGFCINCHRETGVKFTENAYYDNKFQQLHEDLKSGKIDKVTVNDIGGTECQRCHY